MKCLFLLLILHIEAYFLITAYDTDHRIIGGRPALEGELPYQVSIRRSYNDKHFCGGTLINEDTILTAAHCMYYSWGGVLPNIVVAVVAGQNSMEVTPKSVYRNASRIIIHEDFDMDSFTNDIAMIKVSEGFPINASKFISIIPLQNKTLYSGACVVSGWGVQEVNSTRVSDILLAVDVDIVNMTVCTQKYRALNISLSKGMLCAGVSEGEKDACQGDSGGPLVCNGYLTGVVSTGKGCADPRYPGIYTDVFSYYKWIQDELKKLTRETEKITIVPKEQPVIDNIGKAPTFLDALFVFNSAINLKSNHLILFSIVFVIFFRI